PKGGFNNCQSPCVFGPAGVPFGDGTSQFIGGSVSAANAICPSPDGTGTPLGGTLGVNAGTCAGLVWANCLANFQTAFQQSYAVGNLPNPNYINNSIANNALNTTGLLDPNYKSPRSVQINVGVQRQLRQGMVLSVDYLRNVGLHYLIGTDINHTGDVAF